MCRCVAGECSGGEDSKCKGLEGGDQRPFLKNRMVVGGVFGFCAM